MNTPAQAIAPLSVSNAVTAIREFLAFKPGIAEYGINIQRVQKIRSCEEPARMANTPHVIINSVNLLSVQRSKPPPLFLPHLCGRSKTVLAPSGTLFSGAVTLRTKSSSKNTCNPGAWLTLAS